MSAVIRLDLSRVHDLQGWRVVVFVVGPLGLQVQEAFRTHQGWANHMSEYVGTDYFHFEPESAQWSHVVVRLGVGYETVTCAAPAEYLVG